MGEDDKRTYSNFFLGLDNNKRISLEGIAGAKTDRVKLGNGFSANAFGVFKGTAEFNLGVTPEQGAANHKARITDAPRTKTSMDLNRLREALGDLIATTGGSGDIRSMTVSQVAAFANHNPDGFKPEKLANFNKTLATLDATNYVPPPELLLAQQAVATLPPGVTNVTPAEIKTALSKVSGGEVSDSTVNWVMDFTGGDISSLRKLPPELLTSQNAGATVRQMTLTDLNTASSRVQASIAANGGVSGAGDRAGVEVNQLLALMGQPQLPSGANGNMQRAVEVADRESRNFLEDYSKIPSPGTVKGWKDKADKLAQYDPHFGVSVATGVNITSPKVSGVAYTEAGVAAGTGNIMRDAETPGKIFHPARFINTAIGAGVGDEPLRYSPSTAAMLGKPFSKSSTQFGAFAEVKNHNISFMEMDWKRHATTLEVGVSAAQPLPSIGATSIVTLSAQQQLSGPDSGLPAKSVFLAGRLKF